MDRTQQALDILVGKIKICMTKSPPERGAAVAAIDCFIRERGHYVRNTDDPIDDDVLLEEIGIGERTVNVLENQLRIMTLGQLRVVTRDHLMSAHGVGDYVLREIITSLDKHGIKHMISLHGNPSSSGSASHSRGADPMDQLLDDWLKPRAVGA